ncbi:TKL protein kinase [Salpingoeca rosetta]|uniref:TKL protein kinase n=1 Tax=Salpingoeca rosetta (strain ATCC 50818 / BSB-021) TaxID=946362 RepID=F2UJL3_SALR5|nr:TKL protein kinase [Salpingoeca rosetta]EGD77312.1 TKL protein kinase [Salpingoeca rosetta]|eukprot:XP_004990656.1 TKL protein kinase [Salpingoeca rosetta]
MRQCWWLLLMIVVSAVVHVWGAQSKRSSVHAATIAHQSTGDEEHNKQLLCRQVDDVLERLALRLQEDQEEESSARTRNRSRRTDHHHHHHHHHEQHHHEQHHNQQRQQQQQIVHFDHGLSVPQRRAGARHLWDPQPLDLSPIRTMAQLFGCCVNCSVSHTNPTTTRAGNHSQQHHQHDQNGGSLSKTTTVGQQLTTRAWESHRPTSRATNTRRVRRDTPLLLSRQLSEGFCTLASLFDSTCPGPLNNHTLTITFEGETAIDHNENATASGRALLDSFSADVHELTLRGIIHDQPLQWLLHNVDWSALSSITLEGLQAPEFQFHLLNSLQGISDVRIRHHAHLSISTRAFTRAHQLSTLSLRNNSLLALPEHAFAGMTALRVLDLRQNRIRTVSAAILAPLSSVRQLLLDFNLVSSIEPSAFNTTTQLTMLTLSFNAMSAIPDGLFHPLSRLRRLNLGGNPIHSLRPATFSSQTALQELNLDNMLLQSVPPHLFAHNTRLRILYLFRNFLTSLPEDLLAGMSQLRDLFLDGNRLTALQDGLFRHLTALDFLTVSHNQLTTLPRGLFDNCTALRVIHAQGNKLALLPPGVFRSTPSLQLVYLANNRLRSIDGVFEQTTPTLVRVDLDHNQLSRFEVNAPLSRLSAITLRNNPLASLPDLAGMHVLQELRLLNHHIQRLDLTPVLASASLQIVQLDASPDAKSVALVDTAQLASRPPPTQLHTLHLSHIDTRALFRQALPPLSLNRLHLGWPGMNEDSVPLSHICRLLADSVQDISLTTTMYKTVSLCDNKTYHAVFLQDNTALRTVEVPTGVRTLNVSGCHALDRIDVPFVDVLDVSQTLLGPSQAVCDTLGRRILFARDMNPAKFRTLEVSVTLRRCLERLDVLDLSRNSWLDLPGELSRLTSRPVALSSQPRLTADLVIIRSRAAPPLLQVAGTPVQCNLQLGNEDLRLPLGIATFVTETVYTFHCTCARGFKLTSGGRCVVDNPDIAGIAVGSVIGGLFFGLFVAWLSRRYRGLTKRIDLQEQLLVERDEEVMALKKAWEIEYDELRMTKRVAAGAFGVVFEAEWDTVMVAVKVLQQAVMAFDESTVLEFEKEVEFLQRTRHPNVVRFFGAGTNPSGSPFLVLEFVAMGSLKDLLGKDMEQVLREVRNRKVEESNSSSGGVRDDVNSVWELKLRLLRDIASGMAFIHSLDQMHRDLKSGNVLVSSSLRAKITDFGSIRQCFTRGGGGRAHGSSHTRLSSSQADDDPQYSQRTGLQTMASMTLTAGVGTPLYMAPEALMGDKYSFGADVFSFGVLMWEVATQRPPDLIEQEKGGDFRGPLLPAITELLTEGKRLKFHDTDGIPEWFETLTLDCMAHDPAQRPSFNELKLNRLGGHTRNMLKS